MSAPTEVSTSTDVAVYICMIVVLVPTLTYALVTQIWNQPLRNGPDYFLGVEVPAGFYEGRGRSWLKGYHATVAALYLVWAVTLGAIIVSRKWEMTPVWVGVFALLMVATLLAFQIRARRELGVNPSARPVVLAQEPHRLSDYISWPTEGLAVAVVALSWWLMMHGRTHADWRTPLLLSWVALGLLPGKMVVVHARAPLPVELTEEHYRYEEAERRNWLRLLGAFAWFFVAVLFSLALLDAFSPFRQFRGLRWILLALLFGGWGWQMVLTFRGLRHLRAMYSDLRKVGSWKSPFDRTSYMGSSRGFAIWFAIWLGGILVLNFHSLR
jgi:hypothetical protein